MGFKAEHIEVNKEPVNLYGYHGDVRPEKAEIVIRRSSISSSSNDVGFQRQPDGTYQAIVSDYDRSGPSTSKNDLTKGLQGFGEKWMGLLTQRYGYQVAKKQLDSMGFNIESMTTDKNGELVLECVRY